MKYRVGDKVELTGSPDSFHAEARESIVNLDPPKVVTIREIRGENSSLGMVFLTEEYKDTGVDWHFYGSQIRCRYKPIIQNTKPVIKVSRFELMDI